MDFALTPEQEAIRETADRFAREKYDHFALRAILQRCGVSLRCVTQAIDGDSSESIIARADAARIRRQDPGNDRGEMECSWQGQPRRVGCDDVVGSGED